MFLDEFYTTEFYAALLSHLDFNLDLIFLTTIPFFFSYAACSPIAGYGLLILEVFRDHTQRHTTVGRTPLDE